MNSDRRSAFTLIELIVSLAITSVIAVFVFGFATSIAKLWRTTEGGVSTELDAQITLDRIAMDLESAIFLERGVPMFAASGTSKDERNDSNRWVDVTNTVGERLTSVDFVPQLNNVDTHHYGWAGTWLRFFTASPSFNAVSYKIIRRPTFTNSSEPRYLLHRTVIRLDNTVEGGFDIQNGSYKDGSTTKGILSPRLDGVLLEDVVDFGVRLYVFDEGFSATNDAPDGLRLIYPANDANGVIDSADEDHFASSWTGDFGVRYPDVVEVYLRVLDDAGADLLYRLEEEDGTGNYETIVAEHGRLYRRMIRLPGREPLGYTAPQ